MIFLPTTLYRVLLPILLFTWGVSTHGQIVINEICASNQTVGMDEDGNFPDWFELYNAGSSGVQLGNYKVSDLSTLPAKFALPNQLLNPGEHLRIWASEKNRKSSVHHWETALFESDTWNYFLPTSNIPGWTGLSFDDSGWPSGKGGFGFGDNDDSTLVPTTQLSVYIRKTFTITDLSSISNMVLHLDYDDGFAVWINGTLAARSNLSANPAFNEPASNSNEAVMYNNQAPPYFSLDTGLLVAGNNVICIEVHNNNINSSDLSCRPFLSFGISNANTFWNNPPSWFSIPTQLPIHTNFKLSAGETLSLYDASGTLLDSKLIPTDLRSDQSMGRSPSGGGTWKFFTQPTPGTTNTGNSFDSYCQNTIIFSQPAGFYSGSIQVSLSGSSVIRYTLDGSEPSASSPLYTAPITISSTKVLKAICAATGTYPMRTFVNTYFINVSTSLPVWSISTAPANFFDFNTGIYEMGPNAGTESPYFGANFWEDWERPVFVEFFEKDKTRRVAQGADIRIYGNYSRGNDMKSLLLMAKNKYGSDRFQYKFHFQKPVTSFEDIVLRNSGGDFNITHFRDGFIQAEIARVSSLDYQAYRPSVVFINGAYWGIHNIREKIGADFISENHGIKKSEVDLAETWGDSISGTNNIYYLHAYSKALDMTNSLQYKFVADSFDIPNMIDYFASQIYISNWDWPQNNVKFWRQNNGDRKFRYILWDTDLSLGIFNLQDYNYDQLNRVITSDSLKRGPHAEIFKNFLKNTNFRRDFINRSADLMNTVFRASLFSAKARAYADSISAEIPRHFARWPYWSDWNSAVDDMVNFINSRPAPARNQIQSNFNLTKQVTLTLQVQPAGAGVIKLNTIIPESYPWNGVYFDGVPVTITAVPNPGYSFSNWQSPTLIASPNNNKSLTLNLSVGETITAYFTGSASTTPITISEINFFSDSTRDAGDWIELFNTGSHAIDLTGWELRDNNNYHRYKFPDNTSIAAGGRLVLAEDLVKFSSQHPTVSPVLGPFTFGLNNLGESIRLYKRNQVIHQQLSYAPAWGLGAYGQGYTLELTNTSNPASPSSWSTVCQGGSPGAAPPATCATPIFEAVTQKSLQVFPNPNKGAFYISLPEQGSWKVTLYTTNGILVHEQEVKAEASTPIEADDLPPGLYLLRAESDTQSFSNTIIIQR